MNRLINNGLDAIRPYRAIIIVVALLLAATTLFFYGPLLVNKIGDKWFHASTDKDKAEIQQARDEAAQAKGELTEKLKELVEAKKELADARAEADAAKALYYDSKNLSSNAKKEYEAVLNAPPPTPLPPDSSIDVLCAEARRQNIHNIDAACPN